MTEIVDERRIPADLEVGEYLWERVKVWEAPVRIFHWVNALSILVLFATGLFIAFPVVGPAGGDTTRQVMGTVRLVHFGTAFVFAVNFLARIYWFWFGNSAARSGIPWLWRPSWWRGLGSDLKEYTLHRYQHPHLGHGPLSGLTYTVFAIGLGWAQIFTGFALFGEADPEGFWGRWFGWVIPLCGGSFQTHMFHHLFAWGFVVFVILHVYIVSLDDALYRNGLVSSMFSGNKMRRVRARPIERQRLRGEDGEDG